MARKLRQHLYALLLLVLLVSGVQAATGTTVAERIEAALSNKLLQHGTQGVVVETLSDGRTLYRKNPDLVFVPASNMKLVVSAAALDLLGPGYTFQTSLYAWGEQSADGTLEGDLVLVGGGDPLLAHEHLEAMARKVRAAGIVTVTGDVVGDDSVFDDVRLGEGWSWDYESYYYAAQISGLNLNRNVVDVWVRPGRKVGDRALVRISPPTGYMTVQNECLTSSAGKGTSAAVDRLRGRNVIRVVGSVPISYQPSKAEETITVEDPTLFACTTFAEMLERHGVRVRGRPDHGRLPEGARLIHAHHSVPLSQLLVLMNKPSDNLIAECLLKTIGAAVKGKGTAEAGREAEMEFLRKAGADISAASISDGSGLSRMNYISPANVVRLLSYMNRHNHSRFFVDSLPIAGVDGTLRSRLKGTAAEGKVRAKTGYLSSVRALSGYAVAKSGETVAFSILMNGHLCKASEAAEVQDKLVEAIAEWDGN